LELSFRGNRKLTVTDGHPMLVHDGGQIVERRADELAIGDGAVLMTSWEEPAGWDAAIDLMAVAERHGLDGVRVMPRAGRWADHDAVVRPACRARGHAAKDVYRHNTLPLSGCRDLERGGKLPFSRRDLLLSTGKGASWNQVPAVLDIDGDFARLIGYYLSEGCITRDKAWRVRLAFGAHEAELIRDAREILGRLGFRHSVHKLSSCETVQIKVSSLLLGVLLKQELGCGVRSEDACVPARLMAAPREIRDHLLAGLLRGDGDVDAATGPRAYRKNGRQYVHAFNRGTVGYFSSSPVLLQQVTLLLQGVGLVPSFKRGTPYLRVSGAKAEALEPLLVGAKQEALRGYRDGRSRDGRPRAYTDQGSYATVAVTGIDRVAPGPVYSMEVEGTHTFVTTGGIAVHNCIPIDPFYLTWAARKYGLHTRFIELAGEINTAMPHYVLTRVAEALNDEGKPLKGSRVLVLGVAYKKDVDDPRESPAFTILELMQRRGAVVAYNDPHVPRLPAMRHHSIRLDSVPLTEELLAGQDCVVIVTDHSAYDFTWVVRHARLIVDTRNATARAGASGARVCKA
jgi:hypothetical protein